MTLSQRVAALDGADREVDAEIAAALCGGRVDVEGRYWKPGVRGFCIAPAYTASLDAAMTLVPEGCHCSTYRGVNGEGSAIVSPLKRIGLSRQFAATPALALASAALAALEL